jgi:cytochrome b pre-mRNA-processing protein 3
MFSLLKRKSHEIRALYEDILDQARQPKLYEDFGVPDKPIGRYQMIILHAAPVFIEWGKNGEHKKSQMLFDMIFRDIEYSFREIGVGDLSVPKKMKGYMKDFNGLIHAHSVANADHVEITARNVFGEDGKVSKPFAKYIEGLFQK